VLNICSHVKEERRRKKCKVKKQAFVLCAKVLKREKNEPPPIL
jgi:hypothetical protein